MYVPPHYARNAWTSLIPAHITILELMASSFLSFHTMKHSARPFSAIFYYVHIISCYVRNISYSGAANEKLTISPWVSCAVADKFSTSPRPKGGDVVPPQKIILTLSTIKHLQTYSKYGRKARMITATSGYSIFRIKKLVSARQ